MRAPLCLFLESFSSSTMQAVRALSVLGVVGPFDTCLQPRSSSACELTPQSEVRQAWLVLPFSGSLLLLVLFHAHSHSAFAAAALPWQWPLARAAQAAILLQLASCTRSLFNEARRPKRRVRILFLLGREVQQAQHGRLHVSVRRSRHARSTIALLDASPSEPIFLRHLAHFSSLKQRSLLSRNACGTSRPAARVRRAFADPLDAGQSKRRRPQLHRRQAVGSGRIRLGRNPFLRANAVSTSSAPPSRLNATTPEGHARVGQHSRAAKLARDQSNAQRRVLLERHGQRSGGSGLEKPTEPPRVPSWAHSMSVVHFKMTPGRPRCDGREAQSIQHIDYEAGSRVRSAAAPASERPLDRKVGQVGSSGREVVSTQVKEPQLSFHMEQIARTWTNSDADRPRGVIGSAAAGQRSAANAVEERAVRQITKL